MMKPVTVSVDVPFARAAVYDFLDVMANHEPFTDHVLTEWRYEGPDRGVGSVAHVVVRAGGPADHVRIEVIDAEAPSRIVERNVGAKGRRTATGTYELSDLPGGGTHVQFTYAWQQAPLSERLMAPVVRRILRRVNERAMARLAEQLPERLGAVAA